jgi:hypothetical protein
VLWIGYLKWQLRTVDPKFLQEPILHAYGTIREQDAILAYDSKELARDENGKPITVWDGITFKTHPVTGRAIPDDTGRSETYSYRNPRPARWPAAEFIVGNPPFIGNKRMLQRLGKGYTDALRRAYPAIPESVDLVMYWWQKSSEVLAREQLLRFGLVTTNSITQSSIAPSLSRLLSAVCGSYSPSLIIRGWTRTVPPLSELR